jgi:hypothetical protein
MPFLPPTSLAGGFWAWWLASRSAPTKGLIEYWKLEIGNRFASNEGPRMHVLTIQTKFTFGNRVRFDSQAQFCSGTGTVFAITVDNERRIDYIVEVGEGVSRHLQAGILEEELSLEGE